LGESGNHNIEAIPTGSLSLDIALGIGGVPRGRIVEIFGPESSGKTTLSLHLLSEAQKMGGVAAFIDAEHALDPTYARAIGVNLDQVLLSQPNSGEQALEITEQLVRSSAVDLIVVDSVAALVPEAEITGAMGDAQVGLQARLMSQAMRKLTSAVGNSKTTVVFINQIRSMINGGSPWGPSTTTTGGLALKFYASLRMEIRRIGSIDEGTGTEKQKVGNETLIKVVKNKLAPPFRESKVDIIYGKGIVRSRDVIRLAEEKKIVKKSGAWYSYNDEKLGQGVANSALFLEQNEKIAQEIEGRILESVGMDLNGGRRGDAENKSENGVAEDVVENSEKSTKSKKSGRKVAAASAA